MHSCYSRLLTFVILEKKTERGFGAQPRPIFMLYFCKNADVCGKAQRKHRVLPVSRTFVGDQCGRRARRNTADTSGTQREPDCGPTGTQRGPDSDLEDPTRPRAIQQALPSGAFRRAGSGRPRAFRREFPSGISVGSITSGGWRAAG